jgi:hypothetical protein
MRNWRLANSEQRQKHQARVVSNAAVRAGTLKPQPCIFCGNPDAEKHHPDYSQRLFVMWLCRECHRIHHGAIKERERNARIAEYNNYFRRMAGAKA